MRQRGDTIVEVIFAITIFSLVAVGGLALMNSGTAISQRSLEIGLVRDQIDAQADALRYAHNAYMRNYDADDGSINTTKVWNNIAAAHGVSAAENLDDITSGQKCILPDNSHATGSTIDGVISDGEPFALNIKKLDDPDLANHPIIQFGSAIPGSGGDVPISNTTGLSLDYSSTTYAQVRYDEAIPVAQGIWIQAVRSPGTGGVPGYYDFQIDACWISPGQSRPVTLGTIVRLYDPEA